MARSQTLPIDDALRQRASADPILAKAIEFTVDEVLVLDPWLVALGVDRPGDDVLADEILFNGLLVEHYRSLLSEDPTKIQPFQADNLSFLRQRFTASLNKLAEQAQVVRQPNRFCRICGARQLG